MPAREAAKLVEALARAMQLAHSRNVVHRDLKPANILLAADGTPKITDFGLARQTDSDSGETQAGAVMGTPSYMAPEQASGLSHEAGPAADVYALGAILYDCLAGRPPFKGKTIVETLDQVRTQEPTPPSRWQASVPLDLETICLKCLRKEPENRYTSAAELADELVRYLQGEPILARPVGPAERLWRWCRRNPAVAGLTATVLLATLAGVAGIAWQWRKAVDNERTAQDLADAADKKARLERWERYRSNLAEAGIALQHQEIASARRAIQEAPEEYRGWEWRYFASQLDGSLSSLQISTAETLWDASMAAVHPTRWQIAIRWPDGNIRFWGRPAPRRDFRAPQVKLLRSPPTVQTANGWRFPADDFSIHLWNTETAQRLHVLRGHRDAVRHLAFSQDGTLLGSSTEGGAVRLWDTKERKHLYSGQGWQIRILPDSKGLAFCSEKRLTYIPDVFAKAPPLVFDGHTARINVVAMRPDGRQLASASVYPENKIRLWDLTTAKQSAVLAGHGNYIKQMAYSRDGRRLASASHDMTVGLWDTSSGKLLHQLAGHAGQVGHVAFSPDGARLASASVDGTARLWDAESGALMAVLRGHRGGLTSLCFNHDGSRIVTTADDGSLRIWDVRLAEASVLRGHTGFVYDVAVSPDGKLVASTGWDGALRLWDAATGRPVRQMKHDADIVSTAAFDPEGRRIVTLSRYIEGGDPCALCYRLGRGDRRCACEPSAWPS